MTISGNFKINLKGKTTSGILWSGIDVFSSQFIQLVIGIILARILSPRDFGLIGIMSIFISISISLIDSGFSTALIQKKTTSNIDLSTVFISNLIISVGLYIIIFLLSGFIGEFYHEVILKIIIPFLCLNLIISALSIIPRTIIIKKLNFKLITKSNVIATIISGIISILFALLGFSIWSLVIKSIVFSLIQTLLFFFE